MKTYSGGTSEGFLPATLPAAGQATTAVAPAPEDPSSTFADALEQQQTPKLRPWSSPAGTLAVTAEIVPATLPAASFASAGSLARPLATPPANSPTTLTFPDANAVPLISSTLARQAALSPIVPAPLDTPAETSAAASTLAPRGPYDWRGQPTPGSSRPAASTTANAASMDEAGADADGSESAIPSLVTSAPRFATLPAPSASRATTLPSDSGAVRAGSTSTSSAKTDATTGLARSLAFTPAPWSLSSLASGTATTAPATSTSDGLAADDTDFTGAALIASVLSRALTGTRASAPQAPSAAPQSSADPATTASFPVSSSLAGSPLATIIAHATILAAASPKAPGNAAASSPDSTPAGSSTAPVTSAAVSLQASGRTVSYTTTSTVSHGVEKKSAAPSSERSFLQENAGVPTTADTTASLLQAAISTSPHPIGNQSVTPSDATPSSAGNGLAPAPVSAAGMANGKKMDDMNMTPEMTSLVVSNGTHPLVTSTPADLHIALGTNHDFAHALDQVMHVAELSNMSRATPPLRVAIEIQTPPGAIVNVYVSRQTDSSYRAQLSTNDPQALAWVQGQIGTLKGSTESGSAIRWSPAQLEPGTPSLATSSASTGSDRGYDWDRGGRQDQSGYQQQPRAPRPVPVEDDEPDLAFAETFGVLGGVA